MEFNEIYLWRSLTVKLIYNFILNYKRTCGHPVFWAELGINPYTWKSYGPAITAYEASGENNYIQRNYI